MKAVGCTERFGFIWVSLPAMGRRWTHMSGLASELAALGLEDMVIAHEDTHIHAANWKILVEGGIEAYHFKVAHKHDRAAF